MKKNILIVEYDNHTIDKIRDILAAPMFELAIAEAGDTAKKLLKKQKYDLVITAAMLPKFHGFDLAKFVSSTYPETKIVVMSSVYKGIEYKNQAISEFGADDFIEKPLDDIKFTELVYSLLDITSEDVQNQYDSGSTQIPTSDTKKIKIVKDQEEVQLSSDDIFGDIIDKVEKDHEISIDLEEKNEDDNKSASDLEKPGVTQVLDKDYLLGKTNIDPGNTKFFKEREIDFTDLLNANKSEPATSSGREIEDDISKKLEETLSGLGLETKSEKPPVKFTEPPASPPKEDKIETVIEDEAGDEIEGYEILDMIARGGMAEIYKAKKKGVKGFEKVIVIKKILSGYGEDNKYIEMFVDEAKIAAELTHPNIVQIYDFGKKDNFYFIAMEYVEGKDLRIILNRIMEKDSLLEEHLAIHLIIKTLEALEYAHSAKDSKGNNLDIVHRDISPPNILVSYSGEVKLTDFGVSKASNKSHQTLSGALKGKLLYMSPEQAKAEKNIDNRSDIYSVGVILFELLTGKKLFSGSSEMEVLNKVQEGRIIKPSEINPGIDPDLENIILKAVTLEKSKRYKNAAEMITALENYLYINFNHVPTPVHLQNKIHKLFKAEILKSGIIVNQKSEPYEIERIITPQTVKSIEQSSEKTKIDEEEPKAVIELTEDSEIKESVELKDISEEEHPDVTKFEDALPDIPEPVEVIKEVTELQQDETVIQPKLEDNLEELIIFDSRFNEKKKTRTIFKILLLGTLIVFSIYYFLLRENGLFTTSNDIILVGDKIQDTDPDREKTLSKQEFSPVGESVLNEESGKVPLTADGEETDNIKSAQIDGPMTDNNLKGAEDLKKDQEEAANKIEEEKAKLLEEQSAKEKKRKQKIEAEKRRKKVADDKKKEEKLKKIAEEEEQRKLEEERQKKAKEEMDRKALELKKKKEEEEKNRIKTGQLVSLMEVDVKPVAISRPAPKLARSQKLRQSIIVMALIGHNGNVEKVRMLRKSRSKKIDSIITQAILNWKYKPAVKDGVKVKVWKTINLE